MPPNHEGVDQVLLAPHSSCYLETPFMLHLLRFGRAYGGAPLPVLLGIFHAPRHIKAGCAPIPLTQRDW